MFCLSQISWGQTTLTWDEMAAVKFEGKYDADLGIELQTAVFGERLQSLEGETIIISGYMIPIDPFATRYVLSRFQNANCFFCGNAGPETIIELRILPSYARRYPTDTYATFRGILELNASNLDTFNFVLLEAEKI
jgi:hypothetical protein